MTGKLIRTTTAILLAFALFAAACGNGDDSGLSSEATDELTSDADSGQSPPGRDSGSDGTADDDGDAEASVVAQGDEAGSDDAMSEPTSDSASEPLSDGNGDDAAEAADRDSRAATTTMVPSAAPDGGFFDESLPVEPPVEPEVNNNFKDYGVRPFVATDRDPLSTFALDVDTASYSVARQWLNSGAMPPADSVRVEEYLNSFDYDYPAPSEGLNVVADGGPSPYNPDNVIVRVGVQAEQVPNAERPDASLVFVIDTSGSMDRPNRLDLVKTSLIGLTRELGVDDSVAIVTYSDNARVILPPTSASDSRTIVDAIDSLRPTGSTNLEAGLQAGYELAGEAFRSGGINRVVLASDGVANVGLTDPDGLARLIRDDADRGIHLVTVGVGMGEFNDVVMEQLADQGDGFYAYINDEREADKLFGDDLVSTLLTVAIDGKIQVEFNDEVVDQYRLIGFENRAVLDDDFRNDDVDAGELGAGHQVTALYELTLHDGLGRSEQLGTAQLRWQDPEEGTVRETRLSLSTDMIEPRWSDTDPDFRLAVTVAAFAELLRDSPHTGDIDIVEVVEEAEALSVGSGAVQELVELARLARQFR